MCVFVLSHVQLFATLGTIDHRTLLSMELRKEKGQLLIISVT